MPQNVVGWPGTEPLVCSQKAALGAHALVGNGMPLLQTMTIRCVSVEKSHCKHEREQNRTDGSEVIVDKYCL